MREELPESGSDLLDRYREQLRGACRFHGVARLAVFGSALRSDFSADSDIDFLVEFQPGAERPWLGHFQELEDDLAQLLKRPVDLVDWSAVRKSRNWIRRDAILASAQPVYEVA